MAVKSLPMDEASRMARAAEMGFGDELYHFTSHDITEFVPDNWRGATFFSDTAEGALRGASGGGMEHPALGGPTGNAPPAGPNIMPIKVRGRIFGKDPLPDEWLPMEMTYGEWRKDIKGGWKDWSPPGAENYSKKQIDAMRHWRRKALENYSESVPESEYYKYSGDMESAMPLKRGDITAQPIGYESFEGFGPHPFSRDGINREELRDLIKRLGYSGARISDESGEATAVFDPKNIRSRFADFDPSKADSADLLAANGGVPVPGGGQSLDPRYQGMAAPTIDQTMMGLGMDPSAERLNMLPNPNGSWNPAEWTAPQWLYDMAKAAARPGHVMQGGQWSPDNATDMAMNVGMGGSVASMAAPAPSGALGMNVWHGGPNGWLPEPGFPHGRPRLDRIGTGEGAASYGRGFYSAENPTVAKSYMGNELGFELDGIGYKGFTSSNDATVGDYAANALSRMMSDFPNDQDGMKRAAIEWLKDGGSPNEVEAADLLSKIKTIKRLGTLKHLDLPDEDIARYLDWDAPLSQQPESVRDAIRGTAVYQDRLAGHRAGRLQHPDESPGSAWLSFLKDEASLRPAGTGGPMDNPGLREFPELGAGKDISAESVLKSIGIPGLKYFDHGSRSSGGVNDLRGTVSMWEGAVRKTPSDQYALKMLSDAKEQLARAEAPLTRNYVTWDQDVLDRVKMLDESGKPLMVP